MLDKILYLCLILITPFSSLIAMDDEPDENAMILRSGRRIPKISFADPCLQLEHSALEQSAVMGTNGQIKTGVYYRVQSKFGRYLDMRHELSGDVHDAWSITEDRMNTGAWANDSYQVRLIDQGNGYYRIQSKFGRYLDMRHEARGDVHSVWSITEARMKAGAWANDSYQVRFIPQDDSAPPS